MEHRRQSRWWIALPACTLALLVWTYEPAPQSPPPSPSPSLPSVEADGVDAAYRQRRSGVMVEVSGRVVRLLPDDHDGSRHQRFILRLDSGLTLLIAHNIDLAERVPLSIGDDVWARGHYEYNNQGGVVHWTHRDPEGKRPGGWITVLDRTYR